MFQTILEGRYILTIVLVACIAGYIVYYLLELFSDQREKRKYRKTEEVDLIEEVTMTILPDDQGNEVVVIEEKEVVIPHIDAENNEEDNEEELDAELQQIVANDNVIVAQPEEDKQGEEQAAIRKHKVKNIAEGVSREDILQDKHEKNLQKVKYEALLCKQRNDMAGYEKKLIEGLILDPDDIDIFRQLADFYFSEGKYTKALSMFRKILTFDPNDHHALWQIGEIYIEQGQYEDAQVFIEKALAFSPDNPKYYISLIDICIAKSDFDTAL